MLRPMLNIARRFAALFLAHAAVLALAAPVAAAGASGAADAAVIPFTPDRWTLGEGINVVEHRGAQAIEIPRLPTGLTRFFLMADESADGDEEPGDRSFATPTFEL